MIGVTRECRRIRLAGSLSLAANNQQKIVFYRHCALMINDSWISPRYFEVKPRIRSGTVIGVLMNTAPLPMKWMDCDEQRRSH
jgi:hypothetical protein